MCQGFMTDLSKLCRGLARVSGFLTEQVGLHGRTGDAKYSTWGCKGYEI